MRILYSLLLKLLSQLLLLQEFVIISVTFSGVFLLGSYIGLTWTSKPIPPELLILATTLISGSGAAAAKKRKLASAEDVPSTLSKQPLRDYIFLGAATAQVCLAINYALLIWTQKQIALELPAAIGSLAAIVLTFTDFGKSIGDRPPPPENES